MKRHGFAGFALTAVFLLAGCGAGVIYQTTQKDRQATGINETREQVKALFFDGESSIGSYYMPASLKLGPDGLQVISEKENKQASCDFDSIGDPVVTDYGPVANVQFEVSLKGCNAALWFNQRDSAIRFARLLYTLKYQALEDKGSPATSGTASVASRAGGPAAGFAPAAAPAIRSDVDELPGPKARINKKAFAIVVGIETYRQNLPRADFAASDAKLVSDYLTKVMGYPEENVVLLTNEKALQSDLAKYFEKWLSNNVEKDSTVLVYYSGHGAPNPRTGDAYLVPYDGDPTFIDQTGYPLKRLYEALGKLPAKEVVVALDACFSGAGGRSVLAEGARPLVMNLKTSTVLPQNLEVLAAASGEQISSTYKEKGHGLFTYFLLKGIKDEDVVKPDGSLKMEDLLDYLKPQVQRIARKQYNNEQTPEWIKGKNF